MKKYLAGLIAGVAITAASITSALADGMPKGPRGPAPMAHGGGGDCCCPASKFGGWYAGVHGGFGTLTSTLTDRDNFVDRASVQHVEDGWTFGGQVGYNWVRCNAVFGIEADFAWANLDSNNFYNGNSEQVRRSVDWIGSIRTRGGIAMGDLMIYATGGIAFAAIDTSYINGPQQFNLSDTRTGWVGGLGTEYAWTDRIRITGDLLYYDFGTERGTPNAIDFFDEHHSLWVSRIGINFALGGLGGHHHATHIPMK